MFRELYLAILFCAICFAVPMRDANEMANIRVKRFGFADNYAPYLNNGPYTYKFKSPFFKVKIKNGQPNTFSYPPYGIGSPGGFHSPYGAGSLHHPSFSSPYGGHQYNPYGYGWYG
ncbi:unnamed protein product [Litomosoides sigmodontis]|uniref:Uncharacterized protein n=1 Tax=Litomosoides sigmodontis TaxID=42156 RepID=A0A3P6T1Z2_LITSI|nr:unnamed protein product [Litomosoides sigmodontis]